MQKQQIIAISSDHAGYDLKEAFKKYLENKGYKVKDLGAYSKEVPSSYAIQGQKLAKEIQTNSDELGIGICGTGIGISITVNRFHDIRGARITNVKDAKLAKIHNNANILLFGGREVKPQEAFKMFEAFQKNIFEGNRHQIRIKQIDET